MSAGAPQIGTIEAVATATEHNYQTEVINEMADNKESIAHVELAPVKDVHDANAIMEAEEVQRGMTPLQAFKTYWPAVMWSGVSAWGILMEGFGSPTGAFWVLEPFLEKYGEWSDKYGRYIVTADWQMAIGQMASIGCVIGVVFGSWQCDKIGFRWSMISNMVIFSGFVAMQVFSVNVKMLLVSNLCMGLVWGSMSMMAVSYASEVTPIQLRAYVTSFINLCWSIGGLASSCVLNAWLVPHQNETKGYMLPWCLQWIWPVPLIIGMLFAPESPWWLVRKEKFAEAERAVKRLYRGDDKDIGSKTVAMMLRTDQLEKETSAGATFRQCFRGTDLRRTEVACVAFSCQILCGSVLSWNSSFFFVQAGMKTTDAFRFGLGQNLMGLVGTAIAWWLISRFGRRTIFLGGLIGMATSLICMGFCAIAVDQGHKAALWAQATFLLVWGFIYSFTIGPVAFAVVAESSSTQLRNKTIGLGRMTFDILAIPAGIINPYMINNTAWNWGGKSAFFWATPCVAAAIWCYFRLPEMKDRSYRELDILFERRVPARKFKTTIIEPEADDVSVEEVKVQNGH